MSAPYLIKMNSDRMAAVPYTSKDPLPQFPTLRPSEGLEGVKPPTSTQPKPVIALYLLWLRALICQRFWGTYNKIRLTQKVSLISIILFPAD
ncbi:MAG: hypothetical protein RBS09_06635 [Anaerolineaceae bacterium]|nr:hypothetical protein [Anaerolineaceae bacterium]